MLISYNWLKHYVDLPDSLSAEELGLKLTMTTVEVEGIRKIGKNLENIVVGEVKSVEKHPDADKLQVCTVNDGNDDFQVVCGGSNVVNGMKVAFGKIGAKVQWHGEGDLIELSKAKIRGVESYGMICASSEIGLGEVFPQKSETEILDLSNKKLKVGESLAKAIGFDDVVFDIDNKSMTHRPDLWGHYGMAREVAAAYNKKLKKYNPSDIKKTILVGRDRPVHASVHLSVHVEDKELCPRYMAVAIDGIKVGPSPEWMQKLLLAVGLRPINNIVDITNFILLDLGQPMHAFCKSKVKSQNPKDKEEISIVVRRAEDGEKFTTLDEQEHELTNEMLVIANDEKPIALAGVMGGLNSEISDDTTSIIFESANFDATNIRRTALKLGLRTDSSARFEKSLDPNNCELALRRAVELTLEMCPDAKVVSNVIDKKSFNLDQGPIELFLEFLKKKIGKEIPKKEVIKILESLGFEIKEKKDILSVTVPTWRATKDISIPEDLVEEISRVYGYGNIETVLPKFAVSPPEQNKLRILERTVGKFMCQDCGFTESINYSFISPDLINKIGLDLSKYIELNNPIAKDRPYLRRSLLPNLLENIEKNIHDNDDLYLFEIGKVFKKDESGVRASLNSDELLPKQDTLFSCVYTSKKDKKPFYEVSESINRLFSSLGVKFNLNVPESVNKSYVHPGRFAEVLVDNVCVGVVAEIHPKIQNKFGVASRIAFAELNLNTLLKHVKEKSNYSGVPEYPPVLRDIAFLLNKDVEHGKIVNVIKSVDKLIKNVELFDVFEDKKIGENKKSMAYHITYLSKDKTLEAKDIDVVHKQVGKTLKEKFGAELRGGF